MDAFEKSDSPSHGSSAAMDKDLWHARFSEITCLFSEREAILNRYWNTGVPSKSTDMESTDKDSNESFTLNILHSLNFLFHDSKSFVCWKCHMVFPTKCACLSHIESVHYKMSTTKRNSGLCFQGIIENILPFHVEHFLSCYFCNKRCVSKGDLSDHLKRCTLDTVIPASNHSCLFVCVVCLYLRSLNGCRCLMLKPKHVYEHIHQHHELDSTVAVAVIILRCKPSKTKDEMVTSEKLSLSSLLLHYDQLPRKMVRLSGKHKRKRKS